MDVAAGWAACTGMDGVCSGGSVCRGDGWCVLCEFSGMESAGAALAGLAGSALAQGVVPGEPWLGCQAQGTVRAGRGSGSCKASMRAALLCGDSLTLTCLLCNPVLCLVGAGSRHGRAVVLNPALCQHRIIPCPGAVLLTCQTKISLCNSRVQLFLPRNRLCCLCPQTSSCTTCGGTWGGKGLLLALLLRC